MSPVDDPAHLAAEQCARVLIDQQLAAAGWVVQDKKNLNLFAGPGIAVREVVMNQVTAAPTTCSTSTRPSSA